MNYRWNPKTNKLTPTRISKLEDMRQKRDQILIKRYWRSIK